MSASKIAHFLKEVGNGSEWTGVINVFKTGEIVGCGKTIIVAAATYGFYRLGKWSMEKAAQHRLEQEKRQQMLISE